jgi:hypothetical protein
MMVGANFAVLALTDNLRNRKGYVAAWYWLAIQVLLAPVSMLRLRASPHRWPSPVSSGSSVAVHRRRADRRGDMDQGRPGGFGRRRRCRLVVAHAHHRWWTGLERRHRRPVVAFGGASNLFSFATIQGDRALQLEAPSPPWVWATVLGLPGAQIHQNYVLATREVAGPGATAAGVLVGYAMPIAFMVILVLLWRARRRALQEGALPHRQQHTILRGAFALTSALIVFSKVGSPQYMLWLAPSSPPAC